VQSANFRRKGTSPTNHCQITGVIALSCRIKISAVHCLVLSQNTRVSDRQTDGLTDGQNYDSQDCASITALRGKKARLPFPSVLVIRVMGIMRYNIGVKNILPRIYLFCPTPETATLPWTESLDKALTTV